MIRQTTDKTGETDPNIILIFDVLRSGKRVFLGRCWQLANEEWQWESRWGFNRGVEPNGEACIIMLETVTRNYFFGTKGI